MSFEFGRKVSFCGSLLAASFVFSSCGKSSYFRGEAPQGVSPEEMGNGTLSPVEPVPTESVEQSPAQVPPVAKQQQSKPQPEQPKPLPQPEPPKPQPEKQKQQKTGCANSDNLSFPLDSAYHVVRQDGYLTAHVRSVDSNFADFTNLYAAFGDWKGMRFNGGYIENGKYVASKYILHLVPSGKDLLAIVSSSEGDRVIATAVDYNSGAGLPRFMSFRMHPNVCIVQYGDNSGALVSAGAGWMLLQ